MPAILSHILTTCFAGLTAVLAVALHPLEPAQLPARTGPEITSAATWGYQLQNAQASAISSTIDLLVVDYARGGTRAMNPHDVERFKTRNDGRRRIVLAYMSIGEAENYRYYWQPTWASTPPSWLGQENPEWKGNYNVRFWDRDWQSIFVDPVAAPAAITQKMAALLGLRRKPYLDAIIDAGFDGVYLDRVDAFDTPVEPRPTARADMVAFLTLISQHAKARRPGFMIVPQNGEELLAQSAYLKAIDAVAKEDLFFGNKSDGQPNAQSDIDASIGYLNRAKSEGLPVFVVEYLEDQNLRSTARQQIRSLGYAATFSARALDTPPEAAELGLSTARARPSAF
jgi:cysteinyl-tRNA synthetase